MMHGFELVKFNRTRRSPNFILFLWYYSEWELEKIQSVLDPHRKKNCFCLPYLLLWYLGVMKNSIGTETWLNIYFCFWLQYYYSARDLITKNQLIFVLDPHL